MEDLKGHFKIKKITEFKNLKEGDDLMFPESDLCFQNKDKLFQFEYVSPNKDDNKVQVKPGVFVFKETQAGLQLIKMELRERNMLKSISNTSSILKEANTFFDRLHVYEKLNRQKKRGVLLHSAPGMGKTSSIETFCAESIKAEPGTVVIIWPTSDVEADSIVSFLSTQSEYTKECKRLILIIEDIGGGEYEGSHSRSAVPSGLLNLLDGVGVVFKLPTFIVATTNHPENLLASLANRPGRFDLMISLNPPSPKERVELMKFICQRELTDPEEYALLSKEANFFSIAHLEEVAIRAELHDKSHADVIQELIKHNKFFKKSFEDKESRLGFGDD